MRMDVTLLQQLLGLMEEQVKLLQDLIELGKRQSTVLVSGKLDELDTMTGGAQALIWKLGKIEEKRFALQAAAAAVLGIHPSQLTLSRLHEALPADLAARSTALSDAYGGATQELVRVNQLNVDLTQQAMAYVDYSLQLFGASMPSGTVYSPTGRGPQGQEQRRRLDNRA
jgi:flagellar biosynthesis/type III secretory pathway chaperone